VVDLTEIRRLEGVRRDFVANVSHELKTPLTSIRGYAETLRMDPGLPLETQRQFLDIIQRNADRLHRIVDELLNLAQLESGAWRPDLQPVSAIAVVEEAWADFADAAVRESISLAVEGRELSVLADPGALRQVFANLLENAVRHTPDGGRITVRARRAVEAGVNAAAADSLPPATSAPAPGDPSWLELEVADTGTGIPRDHLGRVFERFYRVDPARSRAAGGTGLGLAIVKHLVESMGGQVSAASELGKGTTIRIRLPAAM
jgi:two-component system phosphate regulon sensor histidine kinase PhoR